MNTQDELDNHANQLNRNNDTYWQGRGYDERPDNWDDDDYDDDCYGDDDPCDYSIANWSSMY